MYTVTGPTLLSALKNVSFNGLTGSVSFDSNGDRVRSGMSFHLWNYVEASRVKVGTW